MEKLAAELIETAIKTADNPAMEHRCLKALSKLSSLHIPNKVSFFMSTNGLNRVGSLKSNPRRLIRKSADDLLIIWMRQLYSRKPSEKPRQSLDLSQNPKPESSTKTPQNPNPKGAAPNKADPAEKLALELVDVAIETAAAVNQPLDDRCIKALKKLSTLNLRSEFIVSSDIANILDYHLNFNDRLKPLIRSYSARLLSQWTAKLPEPACDLKTKTKPAAIIRKRKAASSFKKLTKFPKEA